LNCGRFVDRFLPIDIKPGNGPDEESRAKKNEDCQRYADHVVFHGDHDYTLPNMYFHFTLGIKRPRSGSLEFLNNNENREKETVPSIARSSADPRFF
jgi:predicted glycosyltransferase